MNPKILNLDQIMTIKIMIMRCIYTYATYDYAYIQVYIHVRRYILAMVGSLIWETKEPIRRKLRQSHAN